MGQRMAKNRMETGVRLYHARKPAQAVAKWKTALTKLTNPDERFITLGYLAQAYCDSGEYELMLNYALQQIELANQHDDDFMKSEGFLNLAKAYERLADFTKALSYGKASNQHPSMDPRTPGYAHLAMAMAHLGFSQFQQSLESFEESMNVANETSDRLLELQICVGLGSLFTLLRDLTKALIFLRNAMTIVESVTVDDVHAKYRCTILYHLAVVLRIRGSLSEAKDACNEALSLCADSGNKALHARCMACLADIYRELGESEAKETLTKSWARYEDAFRVMRQTNDRMGEVIVLGSMAKSASESRSHYTGQCECQAIQLNKKCLEIARAIGCRHVMLKCHVRLAELYSQLNDEDSEEVARKAASSLTQEMELFCNFCGQRFGLKDECLQALRCSHIFHERCLHTFLLERADQTCPKCRCRAILSDNISMRTPSICSTAELHSPSTSFFPPIGGVKTPLVEAVTFRKKSSIDEKDGDKTPTLEQNHVPPSQQELEYLDETLQRLSKRQETSTPTERQTGRPDGTIILKKKPPPPPRKPCCTRESLPSSSLIFTLPPPTALSENGPLVVSRAPTITDV
ncbi:unnamed protein product, partial [Mesorhabditis spiculigera]